MHMHQSIARLHVHTYMCTCLLLTSRIRIRSYSYVYGCTPYILYCHCGVSPDIPIDSRYSYSTKFHVQSVTRKTNQNRNPATRIERLFSFILILYFTFTAEISRSRTVSQTQSCQLVIEWKSPTLRLLRLASGHRAEIGDTERQFGIAIGDCQSAIGDEF